MSFACLLLLFGRTYVFMVGEGVLCMIRCGFVHMCMERMLGCARTLYDMLGFARVFVERMLGCARTLYDMLGFARVFVERMLGFARTSYI